MIPEEIQNLLLRFEFWFQIIAELNISDFEPGKKIIF